jgi:hypothetical protein
MKRSVFYDGVEIYAEHLNYEVGVVDETIKNIVLTFGVCGPVQGLIVAPDLNDVYKVSITAGKGYTYGGEYYELTQNVEQISVANTLGAENYICIKVTEVDEYPLPNVISGEVKYTRKNHRYDVLVLGKDEWVNLADKSMYSLLAIVYGSGGMVRGSDIRRAVVQPASLLFVEKQPIVLRGIKVLTVSNNTALGTGTLDYRYYYGGKASLAWKAPGNMRFGIDINIGGGGVYKLWDEFGVCYIQVQVSSNDLLTESVKEELMIINMFEQRELNTGTMVDLVHRSMMGSGMPSIRNPHGQTLDDLDPGEVQDMRLHQVRFHTAGIIGQSGNGTLKPSISSSGTKISLQDIVPGDYIVSDGKVFESVKPLEVNFSGKTVVGNYLVYVDGNGEVGATIEGLDISRYCTICTVNWSGSKLLNLKDIRRWNTIAPHKITADIYANGIREYDKNNTVFPEGLTLSDNLAVLRWMFKQVVGIRNWYEIPEYNVPFTTNKISLNLNAMWDLYDHKYSRYIDNIEIHGVVMGHQGKFDADTVDGQHADELTGIKSINNKTGPNLLIDAGPGVQIDNSGENRITIAASYPSNTSQGITSINSQTGPAVNIAGSGGINILAENNTITIDGSGIGGGTGGGGGGIAKIVTGINMTSYGSTSWTVPAGVRAIVIDAVGGGGGGGISAKYTSTMGDIVEGGGGGGAGAGIIGFAWWVNPGDIINVTVGAGGSGGSIVPGSSGNGGNGGDTIITINGNELLRLKGGGGGWGVRSVMINESGSFDLLPGPGGGYGGVSKSVYESILLSGNLFRAVYGNSGYGEGGMGSKNGGVAVFAGGIGERSTNVRGVCGGGGGGSVFSKGGDGGYINSQWVNIEAQPGYLGSGGGGGGNKSRYQDGALAPGAKGGDGAVRIYYWQV